MGTADKAFKQVAAAVAIGAAIEPYHLAAEEPMAFCNTTTSTILSNHCVDRSLLVRVCLAPFIFNKVMFQVERGTKDNRSPFKLCNTVMSPEKDVRKLAFSRRKCAF